MEPEGRPLSRIFLVISIIVASLTFSLLMFILSLILSPRLKGRPRNWARENELWKSLKRFLDHFSEFSEIPLEAFKLWEKYLVFAILFGNAKKLVKMLPGFWKADRLLQRSGLAGLMEPPA